MIDARVIPFWAPLAMIVVLSLGPQSTSGQVEPNVPAALTKLQSQDFAGAAELLEQLIEGEPES